MSSGDTSDETSSETTDDSNSVIAPSFSPVISDFDISEGELSGGEQSTSETVNDTTMTSVGMTAEPIAEQVAVGIEQPTEPEACDNTDPTTYSAGGDNLDTNVLPRYKRTDGSSNQSLHYFHCLAVKDRISEFSQLPISPYHTCLNNIEVLALNLLPTTDSDDKLMDIIEMIISRVLTTHIPFFQFCCSDIVDRHLEHKYYKEMSAKSEVVCICVVI